MLAMVSFFNVNLEIVPDARLDSSSAYHHVRSRPSYRIAGRMGIHKLVDAAAWCPRQSHSGMSRSPGRCGKDRATRLVRMQDHTCPTSCTRVRPKKFGPYALTPGRDSTFITTPSSSGFSS